MSAEQIARELRRKVSEHHGHQRVRDEPAGAADRRPQLASSYQYTLQGVDLDQLQRVATELEDELKTTPGFIGVNSDFDRAAPSLEVEIDRDRAAALGVAVLDIEAAMGYSFGGQRSRRSTRRTTSTR